MVEAASGKFICIVDESKLSSKGLGPGFPLPVEITPFCHEHTRRVIENLPSVKGMPLFAVFFSVGQRVVYRVSLGCAIYALAHVSWWGFTLYTLF